MPLARCKIALTKLNAEGTAAAASALHVRVIELEARAFYGLNVVDFHAIQIHGAHLVYGDLEPIEVHHIVGFAGELVPLLQIAPSKTDTERLLPID